MSTKIKQITANNFGKVFALEADLAPDLNYLVGMNGAGKTTVGVNILQFVMQGVSTRKSQDAPYPLEAERFRVIGPHAASAQASITFHDTKLNCDIKVTRKVTKSAQELHFDAPEGIVLDQQWLTDLFNYYLIAPKAFAQLSSKEQALSLGIDTTEYDEKIEKAKEDLKSANTLLAEAKKKVEEKSVSAEIAKEYTSKKEVQEITARLQKASDAKTASTTRLSNIETKTEKIEEVNAEIEEHRAEIKRLEAKITEKETKVNTLQTEIGELNAQESEYEMSLTEDPDNFDIEKINQELSELNKHNENFEAVQEHREAIDQEAEKQKTVDEKKKAVKDAEAEKTTYLQGKKLPFSNLSINEKGELLVDSKPLKPPYFSTGELNKLIPILMSSQNPEFKYVFIQDYNLLDEKKGQELIDFLLKKDYQLVIEYVGTEKGGLDNKIILKDCRVVDSYNEDGPENELN